MIVLKYSTPLCVGSGNFETQFAPFFNNHIGRPNLNVDGINFSTLHGLYISRQIRADENLCDGIVGVDFS